MNLRPVNLEDVAEWLEDPEAIGARPSDQAVALRVEPKVSTLRASILRAAEDVAFVTLFLILIAAVAMFGGLQ